MHQMTRIDVDVCSWQVLPLRLSNIEGGRSSSVGIVTKPRVGRPRSLVSILATGERVFSTLHSVQTGSWATHPQTNGYRGLLPGRRGVLTLPAHGADRSVIVVPSLRVNGAVPLLSHLYE
jgi:hypothetical protein